MLIHIFRGPGRVFGFTADAAGANLPARYAPWSAFRTMELDRNGEPQQSFDLTECLDDIERYGFHLTDAHVRITQTVI